MPYSLYSTFAVDLPKKNMKAADKKKLKEGLSKLNEKEGSACLRLILEHATITNCKYDISTLPFEGVEKDDGTPSFDIENLPENLRWILLRFIGVCNAPQ